MLNQFKTHTDKSQSIIVYIMERIIIGDIRVREQFYINLINPTLNTLKTTNSTRLDFMEDHIQNGFFQLRTSECFKKHHINPKDIANKLGMSAYMFNMEMQFPSHDFLYKVARTLDIPFIDFFTNEPYHPQGTYNIINGKTVKLMP